MAEIITRTFELSLGHRFRLYAEWMAGRARREAEAAAAAAVVVAKGRRAQASAAVSERARPAAAPSLFRALRPGGRIVAAVMATILIRASDAGILSAPAHHAARR